LFDVHGTHNYQSATAARSVLNSEFLAHHRCNQRPRIHRRRL